MATVSLGAQGGRVDSASRGMNAVTFQGLLKTVHYCTLKGTNNSAGILPSCEIPVRSHTVLRYDWILQCA